LLGRGRTVLFETPSTTNGPLGFLRINRGNGFQFNLMHFVHGGSFFSAATTPTMNVPTPVSGYAAHLLAKDVGFLPSPNNVLFTGPAGSGLSNTAADSQNSFVGGNEGQYQSPFTSSPKLGPGGLWQVNFGGQNRTFAAPDPDVTNRLVVPFPTVTLNGGVLQQVNWTYRNPATGATLSSPPGYMVDIQFQVDHFGGRYDSDTLTPATTSHTLSQSINWTNVFAVYLAYNDSVGNHYVVVFDVVVP
jgi:hypothetical protein